MDVRTVYSGGMSKGVTRPIRLEVRLSPTDEAVLGALESKLGLNKTAVVVLALRALAAKHRIKVETEES